MWQFLKKKVKVELPYDPAMPLIPNKQTNKDTNSKRYMRLLGSPHWQCEVLAAGPPWKSHCSHFQFKLDPMV